MNEKAMFALGWTAVAFAALMLITVATIPPPAQVYEITKEAAPLDESAIAAQVQAAVALEAQALRAEAAEREAAADGRALAAEARLAAVVSSQAGAAAQAVAAIDNRVIVLEDSKIGAEKATTNLTETVREIRRVPAIVVALAWIGGLGVIVGGAAVGIVYWRRRRLGNA